jgi:CubicO group peptidase (beta-lactamase class C family)
MSGPNGGPPGSDKAGSARRLAPALALLLLVAGVDGWGAQPSRLAAVCPGAPPPAAYAGAARAADLELQNLVRQGFPGVAAAVVVGGSLVWSAGAGYADIEHQVSACAGTQFRIGSVSKLLTAAAVGLLYEQHKLDLDAPVQRYVPSFPEKPIPVTTRQLAGHRAGIRHYRDDEFLSRAHYASVVQALDVFKDDPLLFEPGKKFFYSTYGWVLISAVVEGASGQPFLDYMRDHVFRPLGMTRTAPDLADSPDRARFYVLDWIGRPRPAPEVDLSNKWGGGGFLSTAEDLARFGAAHLRPGFLEAGTLELLFTSQGTAADGHTGYGIGWAIGRDSARRRVFMHSGSAVGGTSALMLYPDQDVVIALLANVSESIHLKWTPDQMAGYFIKARAPAGAGAPAQRGDPSARYRLTPFGAGD